MEIYIRNHSLLRAVLFFIISSAHCAVQSELFNKQSPVTYKHDLYKFIETTRGLQSPSSIQKDFHSFIRKTGGDAELQSSYSRPAIQVESLYVPSKKPQGELNEKNNTWKRHRRSFRRRQKPFNVAEPFNTRRQFDQRRHFGRLGRITRNNRPLALPRPREFDNFEYRLQGGTPTHTERPQTFFRSKTHSQISSKSQERQNPFLNQPVHRNQNPNFQNTPHSFISHNNKPISNRPSKKLHNSSILPPQKSASTIQGPSQHFSIFNDRPLHTKVNQNSQVTISTAETDHDLDFSRPNGGPSVDFSSIFGKPVTSAIGVSESNGDRTGIKTIRQFTQTSGTSCSSSSGLRRSGEVWYSNGCRRSKCIIFRGSAFIETDQCDTEIYNTVYKCIIEVDIKANFPHCCPRYRCNPDNLGNLVK